MAPRTVLELLQAAAAFLARQGADSPRLDAEVLLAHVLGCTRLELYVRFDMPLDDGARTRFRDALTARAGGRPTSHVTGRREFYGRNFAVDGNVLTPRPETELLVDVALEFLRARSAERGVGGAPLRVAEIGVGSGCVVGTLAAEFAGAEWFGVDVSAAALDVARRNVAAVAPAANVALLLGDLVLPLRAHAPFDLIVSNPPYVADDEWSALPRAVKEFEPATALRSGPDPLSFHRRIVEEARPLLGEKARVALELGRGAADFLSWLGKAAPDARTAVRRDLAGNQRTVVVDFGA